jgi:low affinity Fe/Cu permease
MVKIPRAVNEKWRKTSPALPRKGFNFSRRRGEAEPRPPLPGINRLDRQNPALPGVVEIQMENLRRVSAHGKIVSREARSREACEDVVAVAKKAKTRKPRETPDERDFVCRVRDAFRVVARRTSAVLGTPWAFMGAVAVIIIWGLTGRIFHYSDTWQLIINTGTTIVTFLMVFLIQNTQNRDSKAIQLKLDELIRSVTRARNHLIDLETLSDEDLDQYQKEFERLRKSSDQTAAKVEKIAKKAADASR